jgi:Potential Queuosine, Q, salvage protein family
MYLVADVAIKPAPIVPFALLTGISVIDEGTTLEQAKEWSAELEAAYDAYFGDMLPFWTWGDMHECDCSAMVELHEVIRASKVQPLDSTLLTGFRKADWRSTFSTKANILAMAKNDLRDLVTINSSRIKEIEWPSTEGCGMQITLPQFSEASANKALEFLVAMGSLNFRFWKANEDGSLDRYKFSNKTGARALWLAFEQSWGNSFKEFNERLVNEGIAGVFGDIPYPDQRLDVLLSVIRSGGFEAFCANLNERIMESGEVTVAMAHEMAEAYPEGFGDPYLKKAQLVLSMHAGFLSNFGCIINTSDLLAFADYQVPRVLRALGVMQYAPSVQAIVDAGQLIDEDSPVEKSIRAATILACEEIARASGSTASEVDNWLWQSQEVAGDSKFHLTPTKRY